MRALLIVIVALNLWPAITHAQATPEPSSGCSQLPAYRSAMLAAWPVSDAPLYRPIRQASTLEFSYLATVPPHHLIATAEFLDIYAIELERIERVPDVIRPLHDAYLDRVVVLSHLLRAHARGDALSAAAYDQLLDDNADTVATIVTDVQRSCGGDVWWQFSLPPPSVYPFFARGWQGA